jgi:hypothetical protein
VEIAYAGAVDCNINKALSTLCSSLRKGVACELNEKLYITKLTIKLINARPT